MIRAKQNLPSRSVYTPKAFSFPTIDNHASAEVSTPRAETNPMPFSVTPPHCPLFLMGRPSSLKHKPATCRTAGMYDLTFSFLQCCMSKFKRVGLYCPLRQQWEDHTQIFRRPRPRDISLNISVRGCIWNAGLKKMTKSVSSKVRYLLIAQQTSAFVLVKQSPKFRRVAPH
jgi:hypothetical protein